MPLSPSSHITTFHGEDKNRISNVTNEITEVAQGLVAMRDDCAKGLLNTGQFDLALKEAGIVQALEPASSVGYLRAAAICQAQGRPQEAVVVCKKGLEIVPPTDPGYTNLKTVYMHAMESSTKRIDFLTQLPADIVATYIIPLLLDRMFLPLRVSTLETADVGMQLARISDHISQNIRYRKGILEGRAFDSHGEITEAIQLVGPTLTFLNLDYRVADRSYWLELEFVLDTCPNLEQLGMAGVDIEGDPVLTSTYPKLTTLKLFHHNYQDPIPYATITNILCHLPSLEQFGLVPAAEGNIASIMAEYCSRMKTLAYGRSDIFTPSPLKAIHGLQKLAIGQTNMPCVLDYVVELLNAHCETLEELLIGGEGRWLSQHPPTMNPLHEFKHLATVEINPFDDDMNTLTVWILDRAPKIDKLSTFSICMDNRALLDATTRLNDINLLSVVAGFMECESLRDLVLHHVLLGHRSKLNWLRLGFSGHHDDIHPLPWLHILGDLQQLRSLDIKFGEMDFDGSYYEVAKTLATECPQVEKMDLLYHGSGLPEGAIYPLRDHPNLKTLCICAVEITNRDLFSILSFPKLKHLVLRIPLEDSMVEMLKKHIPHVDYRGYDTRTSDYFAD
ncbi:predicted protein [Lichtheimia corymbifera JMRC:FSU:9682]|uniref:Uncharacterized protein n=1 Tax=Lichtheimia corymbifera JMRC:FSU:9682 TaxID=1263082 RepID=A0A068SF78_9FUNG|nr:predicted protein [Lichtheimia corymbifera JMRC:FSU:9682]